MTRSLFWFLVRAHDSILSNKAWDLQDRFDASQILWKLAVATLIGAQVEA